MILPLLNVNIIFKWIDEPIYIYIYIYMLGMKRLHDLPIKEYHKQKLLTLRCCQNGHKGSRKKKL